MIILNFGIEFRFLDRNRLLFLQCQCRKKYLILSFNFVKLYIDNSKSFHIRLLTPFGYLVACKRYLQFFLRQVRNEIFHLSFDSQMASVNCHLKIALRALSELKVKGFTQVKSFSFLFENSILRAHQNGK